MRRARSFRVAPQLLDEHRVIGRAVVGGHHDFAVDDSATGLEVPSVVGDLLETIGPVVAPARENLHCFVDEMHLDTIAVELNFMDPSLAGWDAID